MTAWRLLCDGDEMRAVGQPLAVADLRVESVDRDRPWRHGDLSAVLVYADYEERRPTGLGIRAIEEHPATVGRPAWPSRFGPATEKADAPSGRAAVSRPQPDVVRLFLVRVIGDPLAVGRPAERLILGIGGIDDAGDGRGRLARADIDNPGLLRDIGVVRVVDHATPCPVGDAHRRPVGSHDGVSLWNVASGLVGPPSADVMAM